MENKEQSISHKFPIVKVVGSFLLIAGIALLILSIFYYARTIGVYNDQLKEYNEQYNQWREEFLNFHATLAQQPKRPATPTIIQLFPSALFFSILIMMVGIFVLRSKQLLNIHRSMYDPSKKITENKPEKAVVRCEYCGSILADENKKCPGCGSRRKTIKK